MMLRVTMQSDSAAAKAYFAEGGHDYLTEGQEARGIWQGETARLLGLTGQVGKEDFDRLCENRDPRSGRQLTKLNRSDRRVGWDFTFSVPKSVSLAYELTGDNRIREAFEQSVDETMQEAERDVMTRVRKRGDNHLRQTGNWAYARFTHFTNRGAEPHLHAHAFAFNATYDESEQQFNALDLAGIKADAPYFEAVFDARMARKLTEMGYDIGRTSKGWEIAGVPNSALDKFSQRTKQIEALAERWGVTDPELKSRLGAITRKAKQKGLRVMAGIDRMQLCPLRDAQSFERETPGPVEEVACSP